MYRTIEDFVDDWKCESEATLKVLGAISDTSLGQKVTAEGRSLGFLAWHIVLTLGEMGGKSGLNLKAPAEDAPQPEKAAEIAATYEAAARSVIADVQLKWTDSSLRDEIDMYGEKWKRGHALVSLVKHQIHHRAQMTVLMRQAGLRVPGVYGPSREEWSQFGMPPQK
ncbi:MAG: DinB family protein [Bacteroidota bacterium]